MHTHKCTTDPCTGTHRTRTLIARHGQDSTARTQHEHATRQLCKKPIQPSYAACDSAPGALFAPPQLQNQPICERRAGGRTCRPRCRREPAREAREGRGGVSKVVAVRCEEGWLWGTGWHWCARARPRRADSAPRPPSPSTIAPHDAPLSAHESTSHKGSKPATRSARGRSAEGRRAWRAGLGRCVTQTGDGRWCRGKGGGGGGRAGCRREPEPRAGKGGEYVHMQAHGRRRRARIGAPFNEQLVGSKAPAGGRRAERAEEPSLLVGLETPLRSAMQPEQGKGARTVAERPSLSGKLG